MDDGGISNVVFFSSNHCCKSRQLDQDVLGETQDLRLPDQMMTTPSVSLLGYSFGASAGWRAQEEERCYIYRKVEGGTRRHGATEIRRRARVDGYAHDGFVVWRRGDIDDSMARRGGYVGHS